MSYSFIWRFNFDKLSGMNISGSMVKVYVEELFCGIPLLFLEILKQNNLSVFLTLNFIALFYYLYEGTFQRNSVSMIYLLCPRIVSLTAWATLGWIRAKFQTCVINCHPITREGSSSLHFQLAWEYMIPLFDAKTNLRGEKQPQNNTATAIAIPFME